MTQSPVRGTLYLVPTPLDFGCATEAELSEVLPESTLRIAARLQHWVSENAKSTRAFLKRVAISHPLALPLQEQTIQELPHAAHKKGDHPGGADTHASLFLQAALAGHDIGLISEAGMPTIADPGSSVVRAAHQLGIPVIPLVGPVSLLLALATSGLNGQNFAFVGYLPQREPERSQRIRALEALARKDGQTQLFIETPYRNTALLSALLQVLHSSTRLCTASGMTLTQASTRSAPVSQWKTAHWGLDDRMPTVFAIGT